MNVTPPDVPIPGIAGGGNRNALHLGELALGLRQSGLERSRIDLKKQVTLFDVRSLLIVPLLQITGHSRPDIGILRSI
jgi:hypothetical protein